MDLKATASDVSAERDGERVDLGKIDTAFADEKDPDKSLFVVVRSIRSPEFKRARARIGRKLDRMTARNAQVDPVLTDETTRRAIAEGCLLDWSNLQEGGKDVPYSREEAARIMTDPQYWRFQEAVAAAALQVGQRDAEWLEDHVPNSSRESGTK